MGQLGARSSRISDGAWLHLLQEQGDGRSNRGPASFASWLAPPDAEVRPRLIRLGDRWSRSLFVASYPRRVAIGWLAPLLRGLECEVRVAQHIVPLPKLLSLSRLRRKIRGFETSLVVDHLRGQRPDRGTETALGDALTLEEQVLVEEERLFQLELFVSLAASTVDELDRGWQQLLTTMAELGCGVAPLTHRHVDGWRATTPSGVSPFGWGREMTASALATGFPFLRSNLSASSGVLLGPSLISRELVVVDPFDRANPNFNVVVLGTSGGGKSYTAKLLAGGPPLAAKKFGEEAVEAVLAAAQGDKDALAAESADVIYHWLVLLAASGVTLDEVAAKLEAREGTSGLDEKASRGD